VYISQPNVDLGKNFAENQTSESSAPQQYLVTDNGKDIMNPKWKYGLWSVYC